MPQIHISRRETDVYTYSVQVTDRQLEQLQKGEGDAQEILNNAFEANVYQDPRSQEPVEQENWTQFSVGLDSPVRIIASSG